MQFVHFELNMTFDNLVLKFIELLAFHPKPPVLKAKGRMKVGAPKWGAACVSFAGPWRALDGHDVAVPFVFAEP